MRYSLIIILMLFTSVLSAQTPQKIGYVDSQVILTQFSEAIKAQSDLDALTNLWSSQLDSMKQEYQLAIADYQKQQATMNDEQKLAKQKEIVAMEQKMVDFQQVKFGQQKGEIYTKQDEIFEPVKKKIYAAIEQVAKSEGIQFVFDKSGDILLLYADSAFDITFKVLDNLKRGK